MVSTFGNIKRLPKGWVSEEREPIVNIFDEKEEVRIIVEMPGVTQESIKTEIKGMCSLLRRKTPSVILQRNCFAKRVDPWHVNSKYKNGVLEIKINKKK